MFSRFKRGWAIASVSWAVVKEHPKLLILPVISGAALLVLFGAAGLSLFAAFGSNPEGNIPEEIFQTPLPYVLIFAFYFAAAFIVIFVNSVLVFCALSSFAGREPSLREGFATAAGRMRQILAWALVASTVGLLLNILESVLEDKLGWLGSLLGGLLGAGWGVTTYFVLPVLVVEGAGPVDAVKRSLAVLRQTWGEVAGAQMGFSLIAFALFLPALLLVALASQGGPVVLGPVIGLAVIYALVLAVAFAAFGTIFQTGAYVFATTGNAPSSMDADVLRDAFRKK